jgi:hypothetical protein
MAVNDLTTLADVKAWLGRTDSNSDALLSALITRASRQIYSYLQRSLILPHEVNEVRDGTGGNVLVLGQWPVMSVAAVIVGAREVPQAPTPVGSGWTLEQWDGLPPGRPQAVSLKGYAFGQSFPGAENNQIVTIAYQAGYQVSEEPQIVSAGSATVNAPYGEWASDQGVSYASGVPLQSVTGAPSVGQYQLSGTPGTYNFNSGDDGASILVSYGYVPSDLADACIELVAERYKYSERVGEKSHSLGGNETVSFDNARFTPLIAAMLQPYRRTIPL